MRKSPDQTLTSSFGARDGGLAIRSGTMGFMTLYARGGGQETGWGQPVPVTGFVRPIPVHTLSDAAVAAVASVRSLGDARRARIATTGSLTTPGATVRDDADAEMGPGSPVRPYERVPGFSVRLGTGEVIQVVTGAPVALDPVTTGARRLHALADRLGWTVQTLQTHGSCTVEGYRRDPRQGFRAWWKRGVSAGAVWCEPWHFEVVHDARPVAVAELTRVGKAGGRAAGVGTSRLSQVASPWGVPIGLRALTARLKGADPA